MTESATPTPTAKERRITKGRVLSFLLVAIALIWLGALLLRDRDALLDFFSSLEAIHVVRIGVSVLLGATAVSVNLVVFRRFLALNSKTHYPLVQLTNLFFASQLVRYLPGRFWGVVYQIGEMRKRIPAMAILRTNLDQMMLNLGFNALVSCALVLGFWLHPAVGIVSFFVAAATLLFVFHHNIPDRMLAYLAEKLPEKFASHLEAAQAREPYSLGVLLQLMVALSVAWVFYLSAWTVLLDGLPGMDGISPVLLCAQYTLSWTLGFLSAISPGGLGIREAVFVLFGTGTVPAATLALLAIILRFWLMLVDLALFAASLLITWLVDPAAAETRSEP